MAPRWRSWGMLRLGLTVVVLGLLSSFASAAKSTKATILVIAPNLDAAMAAYSGIQGYAIPYRLLLVPQSGVMLPRLNNSATMGNYGGIVVFNDVAYNFGGGNYRSAISEPQWEELYAYQRAFAVRMVHLDVYPGPKYGTTTWIDKTGCCNSGKEQLISITNDTAFPTANIKTYAGMSTDGLYHYPARIVNTSWTYEVAAFEPAESFTERTTAAVIVNRNGVEEMAWFIGWATKWSATSNFLQHSWIHWVTRGTYSGFRRLYLNTQVDDMFLVTDLYQPQGSTFRIRPADLQHHIAWMDDINTRLPRGSNYVIEIGHNGNGDIEAAVALNTQGVCNPIEAIEYPDQVDTVLEYVKIPGSGTDVWPPQPQVYRWSSTCASLDPLMQWFSNPRNRDSFMHLSHTFTHEALNNATFPDCVKEISFNRAWLQQSGISASRRYSTAGLIPPAITGLHNADAIRAWMQNGIKNVVGDNTRDILTNQQNKFWPLISTVAVNGYAGLVIIPRWATTIYYNCDLPDCTLQEWIATSNGQGPFQHLIDDARTTNTRNLLGLRWDPYMFHQANLRAADVDSTSINGQELQMSLLEIWTEVVTQEMIRLTDWPMITKKHDDVAQAFIDRMARDQCSPSLTWNFSEDLRFLVSVTLSTATQNHCKVRIPVTFPSGVTRLPPGSEREQLGSDPLTVWVTMDGTPVTMTLSPAVPL